MTPAQHIDFSISEIKRIKQQFAEDCKAMLEDMATHACTCEPAHGIHERTCQSLMALRCAHAVWLKAQP